MAKSSKISRITIKPGRGRDPAKGRVAFKTGITKPRNQREKIRGDKYFLREKRRQLDH